MFTFIFLFVILPFSSYAVIFGADWIIEERPKLRPLFSIVASLISAYALSLVFDFIIKVIIKDLEFRNTIFPLITWGVISMTLFYVAREMATRKIYGLIGYYVFGIIAVSASFIGHSYNIYIGLLLMFFGVLNNFLKNNDKSSKVNPTNSNQENSLYLNQAQSYFIRGLGQSMNRNYKKSIREYTMAIEINPEYAEAYYNRGSAKLEIGQKESGHLDIIKAGELGHEKAIEDLKNIKL